jgi:hypothetical protein
MNLTIKLELLQHVIDILKERDLDTLEDLHHLAFNEDYYIIGYHQANEWLKSHNIDAFEAIAAVIEWESNVLGEVTLKPTDINSERIVNLYVYVKGEELLDGYDLDQNPSDLLDEMIQDL